MQELCQLSSTVSDVIKDKFYEALPYTILCHVETSAVSMLHKKNQLYITSVPVTQGTSIEPILMIVHTINILLTHLQILEYKIQRILMT